MSALQSQRGAAPVGVLSSLEPIEAGAVLYLRLWCSNGGNRQQIRQDFETAFGVQRSSAVLQSFEQLCEICVRHGRRPLMYHSLNCDCVGADESCFANFIACAADGQREDAMLIATLLVRADYALCIADLAQEVGLALKSMAFQFGPKSSAKHPIGHAGNPVKPPILH